MLKKCPTYKENRRSEHGLRPCVEGVPSWLHQNGFFGRNIGGTVLATSLASPTLQLRTGRRGEIGEASLLGGMGEKLQGEPHGLLPCGRCWADR